ncbi:MAG: hypothetical protein U1E73_14230 [Planctomycetota bacterium]
MDDTTEAARPAPDAAHLAAEAVYLHRCLFAFPIGERTVERYVRAHDYLQLAPGVDVARIVERRLDAEAIEFWLRRRSPHNALTQKLRTLLYLVEIDARYYGSFVRDRGSFASAAPWLVLSPVRSLGKLWKGRRQARRHDVV